MNLLMAYHVTLRIPWWATNSTLKIPVVQKYLRSTTLGLHPGSVQHNRSWYKQNIFEPILSERHERFLSPYLRSQRNWMATFNNSYASRKSSGHRDRRSNFHLSFQTQLSHRSVILELYLTYKCAHFYNVWLSFFQVCAPVEYLLLHILFHFLFMSCISYLLLCNKFSPNSKA